MSSSSKNNLASEVIAASVGGAISASILYPLEVVKTQMQAQHKQQRQDDDDDEGESTKKSSMSMIPFMKHLYETQGARVFWHGMETSAFQSATEKALYFFAYTLLKQSYQTISPTSQHISTLPNLLLGYLADWAHLGITLPIDAWTTRIQTASQSKTSTESKSQTPLKILLTMLQDDNVHFYKGLQAYYLLCLKPALQYTVYEQCKNWYLTHKQQQQQQQHGSRQGRPVATNLTAPEAFALGMVARTVATVFIFPFLRAKVILQTSNTSSTNKNDKDASQKSSSPTVWSLLRDIQQKDGLQALFVGLGPELTRGVLSAALMLMIKEKIAVIVKKALQNR